MGQFWPIFTQNSEAILLAITNKKTCFSASGMGNFAGVHSVTGIRQAWQPPSNFGYCVGRCKRYIKHRTCDVSRIHDVFTYFAPRSVRYSECLRSGLFRYFFRCKRTGHRRSFNASLSGRALLQNCSLDGKLQNKKYTDIYVKIGGNSKSVWCHTNGV